MAGNTSNIGFEKQIWDAACVLRGNIDASEYKSVVLGLIFLKYISDRFAAKYKELVEEGDGFEEDQDEYTAENIFFVPENARWSAIAAAAHTPEIGTVIDDAMRSIEKENKRLKDILPKNFARPELDKRRLGEVVDLFTNIQMIEHGNSKDILGRTYHYEQGGDAFHAFQYKVRRFRTYVFFNYALLNGMPSSSESLLDSTPEALESFQKMKKELCHLQRLHPEDSALKAAETDLYYSIGCFCIYRGLYEQGVSAIRKLLQNPALSEEARDLAHEQMIFYGIQTYQTNVMRENIDAALSLTKGKNAARYAINRRYNGYLLVMEGRYEDAREELLRTLVLLHDSAEDEVERRLQSAYAHDYIGEAYRKQGMYARAIEEYQIAIDMIGEYPTSTSTPIFYVDWAMASLAIGDYAAAHNALSNSNRAADNVKEPTGYFRTLYCACNALMCFADGDYRHCASEILQCEQLTKALIVPYDTGILYLTKALLCCYSAQLDIAETPLADVLTEDIAYYCAHCRKCMAGGKAGAFEQELLKRLECGCSDPLPGFLQVTKN